MFVGANADEVPAIGGPPASITSSLAWVEADGAVARVVRHSHHPSKATIETRAMPNVSRALTRSAKPNPPRPSILLILGHRRFCGGRGGYAPRARGRSSVRLSANYADSSACVRLRR